MPAAGRGGSERYSQIAQTDIGTLFRGWPNTSTPPAHNVRASVNVLRRASHNQTL